MEILFTNCYSEAMPHSSARPGSPLKCRVSTGCCLIHGREVGLEEHPTLVYYVIQTLGIAIGTKDFTRCICFGRQIVKISCCLYRILFGLSFIPKAKV